MNLKVPEVTDEDFLDILKSASKIISDNLSKSF